MTKKSKGPRRKTRKKLSKKVRDRGLIPASVVLHEYKPEDKVVIKINPSVHKGMPHPRFHGKLGSVISERGSSYLVRVKDGGKNKIIIVRPEHLRAFPD